MGDLLKPIATRTVAKPDAIADLKPVDRSVKSRKAIKVSTPEDAIQVLKGEPSIDELSEALCWIQRGNEINNGFKIKAPSSKASRIIFVLVDHVIPSYWDVLQDSKGSRSNDLTKILVHCLSSVAGIGAIASRIQVFLTELADQGKLEKAGSIQRAEELVNLLEHILQRDSFASEVWNDLKLVVSNESKRALCWREFVSLLAGGRLLSLAAQVHHVSNEAGTSISGGSWLSIGSGFTTWLGRSCAYMIERDDHEARSAATQLLRRSLTLGYSDHVVETAFWSLLAGEGSRLDNYREQLEQLNLSEQKNFLFSLIRNLSKRLVPVSIEPLNANGSTHGRSLVTGAAALLKGLTKDNDKLQSVLIQWITGATASGFGKDLGLHRAVIASFADNEQAMKEIFQRSLSQFGDKLYTKHTPMLQQEVNVQILLIASGYLYRQEALYVANESRSSSYINAISNRLSASSQRACLLGMLVGTAISDLVDARDKRMNFSDEDVDSAEGRWYRSMTGIQDSVGSISDLKSLQSKDPKPKQTAMAEQAKYTKGASSKPSNKPSASKIVAIEELDGDTESEDEDLVAYQKPDSDASDEDEDATLVQRNKPTAPVYIRDLIAGLRDTENFDRHNLALTHASGLIRRKASFGSEVSEHIVELATLLVGLSDKYNMEDFQKLRLQGIIAVIIAQPLAMGQWFSRTFFQGEYSLGQRASILTTLSLAARELAGLQDEDSDLTGASAIGKNPFASKVLPDKLHKIYAIEAKPVDAISEQMEKTMIKPMAIEAADAISGPNALKVRTFSSRIEVEKKRAKPMPNELAKMVADGFFFPLTGLWSIQLQAYGDKNVHTSPFLLTQYLKTLSLILHAAGTSPVSLPQMTSEFWDLLLSLRLRASDIPVLEALLFSFLTLLDINSGSSNQRRLAEEHAKELLETQEWVQMVFEKVSGGSEEGERVRMLAAGVLTRTREVVEKYQRLLLGDLANFM